MLLLALLGALCGGVAGMTTTAAPEPAKCCFDKQYGAIQTELGGRFSPNLPNGEGGMIFNGVTALGFDFYRQRYGQATRIEIDGHSHRVYELRDFNLGFHYRKVDDNDCIYWPMHREDMPSPCIPDNARFKGKMRLGYGQSSVRVNLWEWEHAGRPHGEHLQGTNITHVHEQVHQHLDGNFTGHHPHPHGTVQMAVTTDNCIPVMEIFSYQNGDFAAPTTLFFRDYHPGLDRHDLQSLRTPENCSLLADGTRPDDDLHIHIPHIETSK